MGCSLGLFEVINVLIEYCRLIVACHTECPHFVFLKTVINYWHVVVWRICVQ